MPNRIKKLARDYALFLSVGLAVWLIVALTLGR